MPRSVAFMVRALGAAACLLMIHDAIAQPPAAPVRPVVDRYHGRDVVDPYRYMEDFQNPDVQRWVKQQAEHAERTLQSLPGRGKLLERIAELDAGAPYSLFGVTRRSDGELFYFKQAADENVAKVYVREAATGRETRLIDPESFREPGSKDHYSLGFYRVSPDGKRVLYGIAKSGSEQTSLRVFDRTTGRDLPDVIDRLESDYVAPYWLPDGESFVYSRRRKLPADAPAADGYKFTQAFVHRLGDDPDRARPAFGQGADGSPEMAPLDFPALIVTPGSDWVVGQVKHGDETDVTLYAARRESIGLGDPGWRKICGRDDLVTGFAVRGDEIYLLTAHDAPRFQVVRTSLERPDVRAARVIVPPGRYVVDAVAAARDALYVGVLEGAPQKVWRVAYGESQAAPRPIELPADEPSASLEAVDPGLPGALLRTRSWTRAGRLYAYDPDTGRLVDTQLAPRGRFDAPEGLASTEVLVTSHDGVQVPLSIIHPATLRRDGSHPVLLSGYGAYGSVASMSFDPVNLAWLERGGILAIAHVRGGGTFGKEWHHAGRKRTKPNTWKDFIACAEHLVREKYTTPARLAGKGGSAGGILIGRSITERPDLFAAAQIAVGCTDMLRFETTLNGPPNIPEFGTVTDPELCAALHAMSTLHHVRDGEKYPAVLLTHGINDPRVEPWQSAKATARLQSASASGKPVLFRVDYHAGHGIGSTRRQRQEERADVWSFLLWQFGDAEFQPR